ncbi:MAG: RHS repeat domain-containing protein [Xanthomarina gelatinilytica]|uniref:RHS repeat domain-containing protein n=1 Tax=Xanthomarina gelatinilytica TaxID=1137281 RepID=UPI003A8860B2
MKDGINALSLTNKTDYYPFGSVMPKRNVEGNYRYKFQGQEKDPETGMEAFELRLWDGRIGRWLTIDPAGQYASPYIGMGNNPISRIDPDGGQDCNCNGGFFKRLFGKIGSFFKNNFGRYRPLRQGTKRYKKSMSRNLPTYISNKVGRETISSVSTITPSGISSVNSEPLCYKLVTVTESIFSNSNGRLGFLGSNLVYDLTRGRMTNEIYSDKINDPMNFLSTLSSQIKRSNISNVMVLFPKIPNSGELKSAPDVITRVYNTEYNQRFQLLNNALRLNTPTRFRWGTSQASFSLRNPQSTSISNDFTVLIQRQILVPCNE